MNKTITLILITIILTNLVSAEYNQENFAKYLDELKNKGTLNQELINNLDKLDNSQKEQIISEIKSDKKEFWTQWKEEFNEQQKTNLLKELSLEQRNSFMEKYGKHYDVNFINLGDEDINFGKENIIGNKGAYFQMDMIEAYNKKNPENKIASIEYKEGSMIFRKEKGNPLEISTERGLNGFYFNPNSGYLGKVGKDGIVDVNSPLTGNWNGKGSLKISTNKEGTSINFDFNRDNKGKANDNTDYAKFTNLKKDSYSVFQDPKGKDEKGKTIYQLKPGELTFDSEGKLIKINDMYKNPGIDKNTKSWGGFFGKDTSITYNKQDFQSAKGSKVMIDLETGQIKSESARVEEGIAVDAKNVISKIQTQMDNIRKKIDDSIPKIEFARNILSTAEKNYNADSTILKKLALDTSKSLVEKEIAKSLGLNPESSIVKTISSSGGLSLTKNVLKHASEGLGATGDISNSFLGGIDYATTYIDIPLFKSLNPTPDSRINLQLNNPTALGLKKVEMYDGSLEIADSYGNLVPVVQKATSYGYILPSTLNKQTNYFDEINFDLYNPNYKNGQNIQIFSNNGQLNAVGIGGLKNLETVNGKYVIDAGGGVSYRYKVLFWGDEGYKGSYENVLTADYKASDSAKTEALKFQTKSNADYKKLYDQYKTEGWTKPEITELTELYNNNFIEYNRILNSKDIDLSVSSSRLNQILNSFSSSGSSPDNPILQKIENDVYYNNKYLQKQLAERGMSPFNIEPFVNQEISNINNFIKSNPGTYLQFIKDSSNEIYQIKTNGAVYNVDPSIGPFISSILPVIISHGGIDSNGNFYLDTRNSRFGNTIGINVYGGHYEGVKASRWAQKNAGAIGQGIREQVERIIGEKIIDPSSR